jgi:translation initiation factor 6 (eIF-6)
MMGGRPHHHRRVRGAVPCLEPCLGVGHRKGLLRGVWLTGVVRAGNKKGLLVPSTATDQELQHLRNSLPDR